MTLPARAQTVLYAVVLFAFGLLYRATFLSQGFNASDEAFMPAIASRIVKGQTIYRDFYYASPPLTPFKEAVIASLFGPGYGYLLSRWVFAVEVSLASVIAFLIVAERSALAVMIRLPSGLSARVST